MRLSRIKALALRRLQQHENYMTCSVAVDSRH